MSKTILRKNNMLSFDQANHIITSVVAVLGMSVSISFGTTFATPASAQTPGTSSGEIVPLSAPAATSNATFAFTNVLEYSDCLAAILDAYLSTDSSLPTRQNLCQASIQQASSNGLSQLEALELVAAADFYSTHFLARTLYPPKGLRLRIAENLGFVYEIDQTDPEILQRAAQ
jgi:hypothetical protein